MVAGLPRIKRTTRLSGISHLEVYDSAHREQLLSTRMMNHLWKNIKEWYEYITDEDERDLPLQQEDILFVFGSVKTTQYGKGEQAAKYIPKGVHSNAGASAVATISNALAPAVLEGPIPPPTGQNQQSLPTQQCLFLQYYKMKWKHGRGPSTGSGESEQADGSEDDMPLGDVEQCPSNDTVLLTLSNWCERSTDWLHEDMGPSK